MPSPIATVLALAARPERGGPIALPEQLTLTPETGIQEFARKTKPKRAITLLAQQQWRDVQQELSSAYEQLPWTARRANVLLDVAPLAALKLPIPASVRPALPDRQDKIIDDPFNLLCLIGRRIRLGSALLEATVETKPCSHIDRLTPGLRQALITNGRGGICCRILEAGTVRPGDEASLMDD